eukprot:758323-Hanusia_phi.AAC.8
MKLRGNKEKVEGWRTGTGGRRGWDQEHEEMENGTRFRPKIPPICSARHLTKTNVRRTTMMKRRRRGSQGGLGVRRRGEEEEGVREDELEEESDTLTLE